MSPIDDFTSAAASMSALLANVDAPDLDRPTPCAGWDVQALLDHIVDNTAFFAGAAGVVAEVRTPVTEASVGAAFDAVVGDVLAGFGAPGILDREIETPYGTFPGAMVLAVGVADLVTHCWDLAHALSLPAVLPDDVVDHAMAAWRVFIVDEYRSNGMFGPVQLCMADCTALDQVAAFAGRMVLDRSAAS